MKQRKLLLLLLLLAAPEIVSAQTGPEIRSLQIVLDQLYEEMIPLCSRLIDVGRGLAGFAAMWYIAARVWRHIANAESIDFYPLLRPFVLGFCIMMFPSVLALMNAILKPIVTGTAAMVGNSNNAIAVLMKKKEEAIKKTAAWQMYAGVDGLGDKEKWYKYTHPEGAGEGILDGIGNEIRFAMAKASYNFRNSIKQWLSEILHILFESAALCINTIRTFYLIVLAILGPLILGIAVFDGLHHTLTMYLARYINVFLWLPVANIFGGIIGKVQENMLKVDIRQVNQYGDTFFSSTDSAYLIFLVLGIVGYFTVPSLSNYIVHASGANTFLYKTTSFFGRSAQSTYAGAVSSAGSIFSMSGSGHDASNYRNSGNNNDDSYLKERISGNNK